MSEAISRRDLLRGTAGAVGLSVAAPFLNLGRFRLFAGSSREYSAQRGYSDDAIRGILGGNFQRVLGEIWAA